MDVEDLLPEDNERASIRNELSTMPFEELMKLKERLGTKVLNNAIHGSKCATSKHFSRENKNRPREMTSKKQVSRSRAVYKIKPTINRDPRFDDLSGEFKEELFNSSYKFLDDLRKKEKHEVEKELSQEKNVKKKIKLKSLLQSMNAKETANEKKQKEQIAKKEMKQKHKEEIKQGKKPWFPNKSEKQKLELIEKYEALKESGSLEKYMAKKRKKNARKEKVKIPRKLPN